MLRSFVHGVTAPVEQYEVVIMFAYGFCLYAQLPYFKKLIDGYHNREVSTLRVHLIWQLKSSGTPKPS